MKEIYLDAPNVGALEKEYLNKALDTGFISTIGPFVPEFEGVFSSYLEKGKAVSTQNGTSALHIALYELGIGPGDEVIVPALTFVATVNPVIYLGARPVFVDVDARTWNIDPDQIEKNISQKTKAIIPVHLYGNPCDMDEIMNIAGRHGLRVVEDATESLGAKYKAGHMGTIGDMGCFSFNGNKTITTGGGGMVAGRDVKKMEHIKFLVNQAKDEKDPYHHAEVGFNYRMTNLEAAVGLAQMEKLSDLLALKKKFYDIYREELSGIESVKFQSEYEGAESSWWLTCACFSEKIDIDSLQGELKEKGIQTRKVFRPVNELPPYRDYKSGKMDTAQRIHERGLCLPGSTLNSFEDIRFVCGEIKKVIREK